MSIINFTVEYDLLASQSDSLDSGIDADIIPLIGDVLFSPLMSDERAVLSPDYLPRPAGLKLRPATGYIDTDGRLKSTRSGTIGVRLWANDPVLGLDGLTYRVDFSMRTPMGEPVRVDHGYITAPPNDVVMNLADQMHSTGTIWAPRISGGTIAGSAVNFVNTDGSELTPINIPAGALVFVDNGDSTWSVGG